MKANLRSINFYLTKNVSRSLMGLANFIHCYARHKRNKSNYSVEIGSARDANGQWTVCDEWWAAIHFSSASVRSRLTRARAELASCEP